MTWAARILILAGVAATGLLAGMMLGSSWLGPDEMFRLIADANNPFGNLLIDWRLPRVLTAFIVGALLGASGAIFQGVFRNPLAEPYLLGTASGASVGATIALLAPLPISVTLGGVQTPFWHELCVIALAAGALTIAALFLGLGEDVARNMGVHVERFVLIALLTASAMVALTVSWGGTIDFLGLVVPHLIR